MHQLVMRQVGQGFGHAIALNVPGTDAVDHRHAAQPARHHRLIRLRAHPQHTIETFREQVDLAVGGADFQLDQRVCVHKVGQARQDQIPRHDVGHVHANTPAQLRLILAKQAFEFLHV